ncbi:uncharacterized protein [Engystomops pustulosus]|uniref:uncharacterized protein n=1 Tax=Engystomops pustulosus TaxID=76066 RepID=UPI003AFB35E2
MVEVVAFLRLQDISIIPYLDDLLIIGKDKQNLILARESSLRILTELGWLINLKKSSLVPSTRKTFLGIILDSTHQMSFLPQEKISNIKHQIRSFRRKDSVPVRQAMKILGLLTACLPAVAWSQSHTRILQNWILTFWNRKSSGLDKKIRIPSFVKRDLLWWTELRNLEKGVCWHHLPSITIVTDASSSGWGAILPSHYEQGSWTLAQARNSSNYRELRAVWEALRSNTAYLRNHHIHILSDNISTVSYLRRQGGTRSPVLSSLARTIFQWAEENILSISATHLKGSLNREADYLSRREILPNEWCLNQEIFLHLTSVWGMPQIDLFATRENSKCQQYFSLEAGESRDHMDAFSHRWSGSLMYAFPPIPLIARVLRKILLDGSRVILICPNWPKKKLVPTVEVPICPATSYSTDSEGPSIPRSDFPSRSRKTPSGGLDPEFEFLRSQGLSRAVITTLKASRKKVTFAIYHKIWKKFVTFCGANPPSQSNPNILQVLDFLQKGLEIGLSTSTLKVQISALSAFFDHPLADHRWVKRFIAAANRIRPQILKRVPSWDLSLVLDALSRPPFEPLKDASIKNLTLKTSLLIAVTSARNLGELQAISIREPYMCILPDRITLTLDPSFIPKVASGFHKNQEIILPSFYGNPSSSKEVEWHSLDFQGKNKGVKASKTTIARWLKTAIASCYTEQGKEVPPNLKAHSTRAISASWAEKRGASLEQICRAATWVSSSTFAKHYRLDLPNSQDLAFGQKVLQAVVPP